MDLASHALWGWVITRVVVGDKGGVWLPMVSANLPDVVGLTPAGLGVLGRGLKRVWRGGNEKLEPPEGYVRLYRMSQSLIVWLMGMGLIALGKPEWWWLGIPWLAHLVVDSVTHRGKWATRLFFPVSDWHLEG